MSTYSAGSLTAVRAAGEYDVPALFDADDSATGALVFEDGTRIEGTSFGAEKSMAGEWWRASPCITLAPVAGDAPTSRGAAPLSCSSPAPCAYARAISCPPP